MKSCYVGNDKNGMQFLEPWVHCYIFTINRYIKSNERMKPILFCDKVIASLRTDDDFTLKILSLHRQNVLESTSL